MGVCYVKILRRVQSYAPWVSKAAGLRARAADDFNGPVVCVKYLQPAVAELAYVLPPGLVHTNVVRITQFTQAFSGLTIGAQEMAVTGKNLDAMIARIGHIQTVLGVHAQTFRPVEFTWTGAGMAEAAQEFDLTGRWIRGIGPF